jgi:cytochrome c biogenesis protein CcmG/thiol:disulfide interchange protein DsbE
MKEIKKITTMACFVLTVFFIQAQPSLSETMLKNMHGAMISFSSATRKDSIILVCFWATTSEQSINELSAINAHYEKWKETTPFKMMAVSIDQGNMAAKVRPTANMNGWLFDVYVDINGDLKKTLHANNLPVAMIIKGGKVTYQQSGFEQGSENYLIQKIREMQR